MKRLDRKSDCAINYTLEAIGDPWSLLIIRDIVYYGKSTYGDFLASEESIATSALARRLVDLESKGILLKQRSDSDKRKEIYKLTEKGLDLIPIVIDFAEWGVLHDPDTRALSHWIAAVKADRTRMIKRIRAHVQAGRSIMTGNDSLIKSLDIK